MLVLRPLQGQGGEGVEGRAPRLGVVAKNKVKHKQQEAVFP